MKSRLLTYLMLLAFLVAIGVAISPLLVNEIRMGADGLPIGVVRIYPCPTCDGTAVCIDQKEGYLAEFYCRRCGRHFPLSKFVSRE